MEGPERPSIAPLTDPVRIGALRRAWLVLVGALENGEEDEGQ